MSDTITFTDGSTFTKPATWTRDLDKIVGYDLGTELLVQGDEHMLWTLTSCCGASFKGCDGYIGCRACYRPVEEFGGGLPVGPVLWRYDVPAEYRERFAKEAS